MKSQERFEGVFLVQVSTSAWEWTDYIRSDINITLTPQNTFLAFQEFIEY